MGCVSLSHVRAEFVASLNGMTGEVQNVAFGATLLGLDSMVWLITRRI